MKPGETIIRLPAVHAGQKTIIENATRWNQVCCGRRWGKTYFLTRLAVETATRRQFCGIFVPQYKYFTEIWREVNSILKPIKTESNKNEGIIRTVTGGLVEFWTLENEDAGRSRKYHRVLIDEAAFAKDGQMEHQWQRAIMPTLVDYKGQAFAFSTPCGTNPDNWFYQLSLNPEWRKFTAPTRTNPNIPPEELERIKASSHPQVWQQEFLAEFVDWSGVAFFRLTDLLEQGQPIPDPIKVYGAVFAVIDSAMKSGHEHDGTAILYCAKQPGYMRDDGQARLIILDWDIRQLDGDLLVSFYPEIQARLERLASETGALLGNVGAFAEDKGSGTILIQQAKRRGLQCHSIDSKLTAMGKDERALAASPYVSSGQVKLSEYAHNKTLTYKNVERNHLLTQVIGFRLADKDAAKRADDLLDVFTYSTILALGNDAGM